MIATRPEEPAIAASQAVGPQLRSRLRARIVSAELTPAMRLSEAEIAAEYGVSRQPVCEAFIKLAEEGLIEIRPQRGSWVRKISAPEVLSARFVREAIEADIVRLAAAAPDARLLADLDAALDAQEAAARAGDPLLFIAQDDAFHRRLAQAAGQAGAWDLIDGLKMQMTRVRHLGARHFPLDKLLRQHRAVVAAIRARDPEAAEAAMRAHLREILNDLPAIAAARPDWFDGAPEPASAPIA